MTVAIAPEIVTARLDAFRKTCVNRQVKITHQRLEIYRQLAASEEHPDADTIWRRVRKRIPTISHDTVYRNLKMLAAHGLISVVGMSDECLRFDANMNKHHHFVCVQCGMIRDFCASGFENAPPPDEAKAFGEPLSLHMEVKGICQKCLSHSPKSVSPHSVSR